MKKIIYNNINVHSEILSFVHHQICTHNTRGYSNNVQ